MARRKRTITQHINASIPSLGKDFYAMLLPALLEAFNASVPMLVKDNADIINDAYDSVKVAPVLKIQNEDSPDDEKGEETNLENTLKEFGSPPRTTPDTDELADEALDGLPADTDAIDDLPEEPLTDTPAWYRFVSGDTVSPAFESEPPRTSPQKNQSQRSNTSSTQQASIAPEEVEAEASEKPRPTVQDTKREVTKPQESGILPEDQASNTSNDEKPYDPLNIPEEEASQGSINPEDKGPDKVDGVADTEVDEKGEPIDGPEDTLSPSDDSSLTIDDQSRQRRDRINALLKELEASDKAFANKVQERIAPLQEQATKLKKLRSDARRKKFKEQAKLTAATIRYVVYNAVGAILIIIGLPLLFIIAGTVLVLPGVDLIVQAQVRFGAIMAKCTAIIHTLNQEINKLNKMIKELEKEIQIIQATMNREYQPARAAITDQLGQLMDQQRSLPQST